MNAVERLRAVLCAPDGSVVIDGSDGDRATIADALTELEAALTREAPTEAVSDALRALLHAVCGETGFAAAVRAHSGTAYPWPALDIAEKQAREALGTPPAPQRQSSNPSGLSSESAALSSEQRLAQGGVWTAEMVADVHRRGDELHQRITQPPPQDRGEVEQRAASLLGDAWLADTGDANTAKHIRTGPHTQAERIAIRAITAALTEAKRQGPGEVGRSTSYSREALEIQGARWRELCRTIDHVAPGWDSGLSGAVEVASAAVRELSAYAARMALDGVGAPQVEAKRQTGDDA